MAVTINYPTTIDVPYNIDGTVQYMDDATPIPVQGDTVVNTLSAQIIALETKVGVTGSAVNTTHEYKLGEVTGGDKAVGKTATQTLTNKTLTSPIITGATLTTSTVGSAGITFTGATSGSTILKATAIASGVISLPAATDTLVGLATTDTLQNKTISTGSLLSGLADESFSLHSINRQAIINGNFDIWQRGTTFTQNDDLYICDHWNALQEANSSWVFSRESTIIPTTGSQYALKCLNATLNNQCGIVQFIEAADAAKYIGRTVSFSFKARTTSFLISNLRATILSWTSTADTITSDVVGTWAQDGTDPTWAANWTANKAGSNLALTNAYQTFKVENITLNTANTTNLAIVIWVDDGTIAANDVFYVDQVQMNIGTTAQPFEPRYFSDELALCKRYYQKSFRYATTPAQNTGETFMIEGLPVAGVVTTTFFIPLTAQLRVAPVTVTYYNPGAANAFVRNFDKGTDSTSCATAASSETNLSVGANGLAGWAVGDRIGVHYTVDSEL